MSKVNGVEPPTRRQLAEATEASHMMLSRLDAIVMMMLRSRAGGQQCKCGHISGMHLDSKERHGVGKCMEFVERLGQYSQCPCEAADINLVQPHSKIVGA